jgi:hypothetical protein
MISSCDILGLSYYIHLYPMKISVSYILYVILFGYLVPLINSYAFIPHWLSFYIIPVILSYLLIDPLMPIKG